MLAFRAAHSPDQEACYFEGASLSFAVLWEQINKVAAFLQAHQVEPGDRVVVVMPNGLEFFPAFYGIQRAGAIAVPLFPGSGAQRVVKIVQHSNAHVILVPSDLPTTDVENYRTALLS